MKRCATNAGAFRAARSIGFIAMLLVITNNLHAQKPTAPPPTYDVEGGYVVNMGKISPADPVAGFTNENIRHMAVSVGQLSGVDPQTGEIITNAFQLVSLVSRELDVTGEAYFYTNLYISGDVHAYGRLYGDGSGITNISTSTLIGQITNRPELQEALAGKLDADGVWTAINTNAFELSSLQTSNTQLQTEVATLQAANSNLLIAVSSLQTTNSNLQTAVSQLQTASADTNNPHQVTAVQVGAYSIEETDALLSNTLTQVEGYGYVETTETGDLTIAGNLTASNIVATTLTGDGAAITNIAATNIVGNLIERPELQTALDSKLDTDGVWEAINTNTADLTSLQTSNSNLQTDVSGLQSSVISLQSSDESLQTSNAQLQTSNSNLQTAVSTIQSSVTSLLSSVTGLQTSNTNLQTDVSGLQSSVISLQSSDESLQSSVTALQSSDNELHTALTLLQTASSDTNNPHQVTAAQVGAYTTDETDFRLSNVVAHVESSGYLTTNRNGNLSFDGDIEALNLQAEGELTVGGPAQFGTNIYITGDLNADGIIYGDGSGLSNLNISISGWTELETALDSKLDADGVWENINTNTADLAELQTSNTNLQTDVSSLQSSVTSLLSSVTGLLTSNTNLQTAVSTIQSSVTGLQSSVIGLQSYDESLQSSVTALQSVDTELQTSNTQLQTSITNLQSSNADLLSEVIGLHSVDSELQSSVTGLQSSVISLQSSDESFLTALTQLQTTNSQLQTALTQLQTASADTNNPHQVTASQVGSYTISEVDTLVSNQLELVYTQGYVSTNETGDLAIEGIFIASNVTAQTFTGDGSGLSNINYNAISGSLTNRPEILDLQTAVTALQSADSELQASNTNLQTNVSSLQSSVTSLLSSVTGLQTSNSNQQTDLISLQSSVTNLQSSVISLQSSDEDLQTSIADLELAMDDLQSGFMAMDEGSGDTNNPHQVTAEQVGAYSIEESDLILSNAISQVHKTGYVATNETGDLTITGSFLASNIVAQTFQGDGSGLTNLDMNAFSGSLTNHPEILDLQSSATGLQSSVDTLQSSVTGLLSSNEVLQTSVSSIQSSVTSLQSSDESLQTAVASLQSSVTGLLSSASSLQSSDVILQSSVIDLQSSVTGLQTSNSQHQTALIQLETAAADTNNPHEVTAAQVGSYTIAEIDLMQSNTAQSVSYEISALEDEINDLELGVELNASQIAAIHALIESKHQDTWSIAVVPDTQFLTAEPLSDPNRTNILNNMFQWIVDNQYSKNIQMVIQLGDLTHHNGTGFRVQFPVDVEYERAKHATDMIDDAGIPLLILAGNHEYDQVWNTTGLVGFNQYFPDTRFKNKPWYGGQYETNQSQNVYYQIEISGQKYIFLGTSYEPDAGILSWCNEVVSNNSDAVIIYSTHHYLWDSDADGHGNLSPTGQEQWDIFIKNHSNIPLVLSGHCQKESAVMRKMTNQLKMCTKFTHDYSTSSVKDWIVLLKVNPSSQCISSTMYSPSTDTWRDEYPCEFTFSYCESAPLTSLFHVENGKIVGFK